MNDTVAQKVLKFNKIIIEFRESLVIRIVFALNITDLGDVFSNIRKNSRAVSTPKHPRYNGTDLT